VHVTQEVRESHKIHIDRQEHQLNGHQQHNQILSVQKDTDDRQGKQHGAQ
jgi:hypothetical protein